MDATKRIETLKQIVGALNELEIKGSSSGNHRFILEMVVSVHNSLMEEVNKNSQPKALPNGEAVCQDKVEANQQPN